MITWYYPDIQPKRATRDLTCSDCGRVIRQGYLYKRHNHGRYCPSCSAKYKK